MGPLVASDARLLLLSAAEGVFCISSRHKSAIFDANEAVNRAAMVPESGDRRNSVLVWAKSSKTERPR